ncbi:hypothetical protein AN416_37850 (plasmid) [Paraburkholderia caribensis]|nr:hypothetical protein AN416_37850 [Paraburkholderia caribensis]
MNVSLLRDRLAKALVEKSFEAALRTLFDEFDLRAIPVKAQSRYASYLMLLTELRILVGVDLYQHDFSLVIWQQHIEYTAECEAWTAPRRPEIEQNGYVRL